MADDWSAFDAPAAAPVAGVVAPIAAAPGVVPGQAAPDGWSAFDAPAGAPAAPPQGVSAATPPAPDAPGLLATMGHRFGLGVRDVLEGVAGPAYNLARKPFNLAGMSIPSFGENLDALGLPHAETPGERLTSSIVQPVAGTLTGQGVGRMMATGANPIVQGMGEALAAQPGTQAVAAGMGGAVGDVTGSPTAGLVASLATPLAGAAIGRTISPNILAGSPERAPLLATAERENIPLTIAQQTGGKVARNLESTLGNLPGSSGIQARANDAQQTAFNRAVLARAGITADAATPDVLNAGRANLGQTFNDLSARNTLQADPQFLQELQDVAGNVNRYAVPEIRGPLNARISDVVDRLGDGGTMPGQTYREMDSAIGQTMRSTTNGDMRGYLGDLRDTLRGAMDRSISPEDQHAWQDVRSRYANLMTIAKAVDRPSEGTSMGNISFAGLAQAARNQSSKSFAFGRGNMDDLSRLGQGALKQTVPDSGTAQRTMMSNLLQGKSAGPAMASIALGVNPMYAMAAPAMELGMPYLAGQAYHSNALAGYLTNDLAAGMTPRPNALLNTSIGAENQIDRLRDR